MAVFDGKFSGYILGVLADALEGRAEAFRHDPVLGLAERASGNGGLEQVFRASGHKAEVVRRACDGWKAQGLAGVVRACFPDGLVNRSIDPESERHVVALKTAFPGLPATTNGRIMKGLGASLETEEVLAVYTSHGLARGMGELRERYDFDSLNRRARRLDDLMKEGCCDATRSLDERYLTMRNYLAAAPGEKERILRDSSMERSLFFYYWKLFGEYGALGLLDSGPETFRRSKLGLGNEARLVVSKLQKPERSNVFFQQQLRSKGIKMDVSALSKVFTRWGVQNYKSAFVSDLESLETQDEKGGEAETIKVSATPPAERLVDLHYLQWLSGISQEPLHSDAPGLPMLWCYLEELGLFEKLASMGLTVPPNDKGYSWFDLFLFNIGRIFYGIDTYTKACEHEEPSLAFFSGLVKAPCNDTLLDGLESKVTRRQIHELRKWLLSRGREMKLISCRRVACDFHHIDRDVILDRIRDFGKGPSPRKKICYNGFRPHIAWDIDTGCLMVAEFRKASARGPTTFKPFARDFLLEPFRGLFEDVYVDSEYTGRDTWGFVMDKQSGMGADLTACLKQNAMVKKARGLLLAKHRDDERFWCYYDENHVFGSELFALEWDYRSGTEGEAVRMKLNCVVKKNVNTGTFRCFGTSKTVQAPRDVLDEYSSRWGIENGIKDLIESYFLNKCPGTSPQLADVHFFTVSVCRYIYHMILRDLGDDGKNPDGTARSLGRMREVLFRQGTARISREKDCVNVRFINRFFPGTNTILKDLFDKVNASSAQGLGIQGGCKLHFELLAPHGENVRNSMKKVNLKPLSD